METTLLFCSLFIIGICTNYLGKKNSSMLSNSCKYAMYTVCTGTFAMINFAIISGFQIEITPLCIFYSIIYAFCCAFSLVSVISLRYISLAFKMVFVGALTQVSDQLIGVFFFKEPVLIENILRCFLNIAAVIIAVTPSKQRSKTFAKGLLLCIITVIVNAISSTVAKCGAMETALDENSWFFLTNFFMFLLSLAVLFINVKFLHFNFKEEFSEFGKKGVLLAFLSSLSSNVWSLICVALMAIVPLSYYSPVSGALSMIASFVVSRFILREPSGIRMYIAVILAIIAIII